MCPPIAVGGAFRQPRGPGRSSGVSTSRTDRPSGSSRAPRRLGDDGRGQRRRQRAKPSFAAVDQPARGESSRHRAGRRAAAAAGGRRARGPRRRRRSSPRAASIAAATGPTSDGMSPPMTMTVGARMAVEARQQPGERTLERDRIMGQDRTSSRQVGLRLGGDDHDDLAGQRPHGIDRVPQQRPARRPARPACRARTAPNGHPRGRSRRRPAVSPGSGGEPARRSAHRAAGTATAAARGPGTWPSAVRRRIPRRSRSARIAMTYLRLVPVASRSAAGVSGAAPARASRGRLDRPVRRRGVGEAGLEHDDPAAAFELADAGRRAARGAGRVGEIGRRCDLRARARGGPSRPRGPRPGPCSAGSPPGGRSVGAVTDQAPVGHQAGDHEPRRPRRRSTGPRSRPGAAPARPSSGRRRALGSPATAASAARLGGLDDVRCQVDGSVPAGEDPVEVQPSGADRPLVARRNGRGQAPDPLGRSGVAGTRRAPAWHRGPARRRSDRGRPQRRRTNRSPVATATGTGQPQDRGRGAVRQVERVPAASPDGRVHRGRARGGASPGLDPAAATPRRTSSRSLATTAGSSVRTSPRCRSPASTAARLSAVRPGPAASTVGPWTWTSRTRTDRSPGTTRNVAPRSTAPPRSEPVTTAPRPLTAKTRSIARREPWPRPVAGEPAITRSRSCSSSVPHGVDPVPVDRRGRDDGRARPATSRRATAGPRRRPRRSARRRRRRSW